jgi:hypothetical protein
MRPRFAVLAVTAAFFLIAPLLRAADVQWPATLGSWTVGPAQPKNSSDANTSNIRQGFMQEAGLKGIEVRAYNSGGKKARLTLYTFQDSSGAYEAFNVLSIHVFKAEPDSIPFARTIYKSNRVLDIASDSTVEPALVDDAAKWVQSISDGVAAPPIAGYLHEQNRVLGSDRYALGPVGFGLAAEVDHAKSAVLKDVAGFESHAEAIFANYRNGKDEATLLLIDYPTPQLAELHLRHLQRALADAKLATSSVERKGSLLSIVLAPTSPEYAQKLRSSVNYETQVTWNEASQTATDPPILSTVAKIFIATGVFMVVTLAFGIAFGGVRVITKRLFPGKVFDRKEQIEVLQLGLSSKPIDPSDMY